MTSLQMSAAVLGGLLVLGSLLSGLVHRSMLSLAALFVLAGFLLGDGASGILHFRASSGFVTDLATIALIVILFRDGLEVEGELLQSHWQLPLRKLAIGLGLAFATYGVTVLPPRGNGFIAVFVAAIVVGIRRPDLRLEFAERADEVVEIVKLGIFTVFASILVHVASDTAGTNWIARRQPAAE